MRLLLLTACHAKPSACKPDIHTVHNDKAALRRGCTHWKCHVMQHIGMNKVFVKTGRTRRGVNELYTYNCRVSSVVHMSTG